MRQRIHGATISQNGDVSLTGTDEHGELFTRRTDLRCHRFDWASIPQLTPVLDLRRSDCVTVCSLLNHTHPSFGAKLFEARNKGCRVTTARTMRGEFA